MDKSPRYNYEIFLFNLSWTIDTVVVVIRNVVTSKKPYFNRKMASYRNPVINIHITSFA